MLIDHVTVTFPTISGVNADSVVNTFTFSLEAAMTTADLVAIETKLTAFYNTVPVGGSQAVSAYMGAELSRTAAPIFRHYNIDGHLNGSAHGSPVRIQPMALLGAAAGTVQLPAECAAVLTTRAAYGTDVEFAPGARPRARDRGRIFIGPLQQNVLNQDSTTKRVSLIQVFRDDLGKAGATLMLATGATWVVWSRRNAAVHPIVDVQVDDAFDVQRRRGPKPTIRGTYTVG